MGTRTGRRRLPLPVTIYLLCIALPLTFSVGPLAMSTLRLVLLILIVPLAIQLLRGRYGGILAADILFPLHIAWVAVALQVNNPDRMVQQMGSLGIELIGGYLLGRAYIRSSEDFLALARALVLLLTVLLPLTIIETLTNRSPLIDLLDALPVVDSIPKGVQEKRLGLYRVQSVFDHPIHFGLFCSMVLSFCYVGLKGVIGPAHRLLSAAAITISGFLALSSGALLAIVLQLFLIGWMTVFSRVRWRWWLLLGVMILAYVTVDLISNRTPLRVFMSYATFSAHNAYWRSLIFDYGIDNVWANPLFGLGLNDWMRPYWMYTSSVDNFWLLMAMRYGIPGFLLIAAGYLLPLVRIGRRSFDADPMLMQLRRAWMFSIIGMSFTLVTVHVWNNAYSVVFFFFGAGMWLAKAVPSTATQPENREPEPSIGPIRRPRYTRFPDGTASDPSSARGVVSLSRQARDEASFPQRDASVVRQADVR